MSEGFAFFSIATHLGGAEKSLLSFLKEFRKNHNVIVFVPKDTGPLLDEFSSLGIPYVVLPLPSFVLSLSRQKVLRSLFFLIPSLAYLPFYLFKIHSTLKKKKWKAIHSTGLKFHLFLCILSLFNKKDHFHIHLRDIISFFPSRFFFSFFKSRSNLHFIFNSKISKSSLEPIEAPVIYNGFDPHLFHPGPPSLKHQLGLRENDILVGIVGVIARWKGQREFLLAAEKVLKQQSQSHFLIVGDEIYDTFAESGELNYLKSWVQEKNLSDKIHFLPFQKNIVPIYQSLDLLVHASIHPEPFGRVLVEAMLCGCPVIATNQGGPLEIIQDQINGLLYSPGDIKRLAELICELTANPLNRQKLALEAKKKASDFSMTSYVDQLTRQLMIS